MQLDTTDIHVIHSMTHLLPTLILADWEPRHGKMFTYYFRALCHKLLSRTWYEQLNHTLAVHGVSWGTSTRAEMLATREAKAKQSERKWQRKEAAMKETLTLLHKKLNES